MYPGISLSKPYSNLRANLNAHHESSQAPDISRKPYASVKSNLASYRTETFNMKTRADVLKLMAHNLNSYGKVWTPKETAKAVKHGWDEGEITLSETIAIDGGSDGGDGDGDGGGGDGGGGVSEEKEGEPGDLPPPDFMSPPSKPTGEDDEDEDDDEGEEGEAKEGEARVVKEGEDTPEAAHKRFKELKYDHKDIPAEAPGKSDITLQDELKEFAKKLYALGVIKTRFYYSKKQSFAENRARLAIGKLGYAPPTASAAAPPTAAAPAPSAVKSPVRRPLTPEVGGSPADIHLLMN